MSLFVDIEKKMGSFELNVKFEVEKETLALLGASGCGKSMTLKCIAGIEKPDKGRIVLDNRVLFDSEQKIDLPTKERKTGLLFQNYALFPNMTVEQNVSAGARRIRKKEERHEAVREMLRRFQMEEMAGHYPDQLSGGQQQRVALARLLVSEPELLMLDEPFSALDSHLRLTMEQEMLDLIQTFGKPVILVSHDRDEVYRMSDKIALMSQGKIQTIGEKHRVFANPITREGMLLTGCKNISAIEVVDKSRIFAKDWGMFLAYSGEIESVKYIGIHSHDILMGSGENTVLCEVIREMENPFSYTLILQPEGQDETHRILWEVDKKTWKEQRKRQIQIHMPWESMIQLKE